MEIKDKMKKIVIFSIVVVICIFIFDLMYRTLYYRNYLKECSIKDSFCGLEIIKLNVPEDFNSKLLQIAETNGIRVENVKKRQKNIASSTLVKELPEIEEFYTSCIPIISEAIGEPVKTLNDTIKTRMTLVVYNQEGDFIDWHFDTNHYEKRFFTLLIPITLEKTCGNYQYKDENEEDVDVELVKGQALLFEGDKVYHRGKMLCSGQNRVILSCTFVTSDSMNLWNYTMHKIKEVGIYGV